MKKSMKEIVKNTLKKMWMGWEQADDDQEEFKEEGYGGTPGKDKAFVKGHRWTVKWKQENMKQNELKNIIQECIAEVINEYKEEDEIKLIGNIRYEAKRAKNADRQTQILALTHIEQWSNLLMKMHKKDPQPEMGVPIKEKYIRGDEQHEDAEVALISQIRSLAQVAKMSGSAWKPADWSKWVQAIEKISDRLLKMHTTSKETPKLGLKHDLPLE
jgi:hypothetical protein